MCSQNGKRSCGPQCTKKNHNILDPRKTYGKFPVHPDPLPRSPDPTDKGAPSTHQKQQGCVFGTRHRGSPRLCGNCVCQMCWWNCGARQKFCVPRSVLSSLNTILVWCGIFVCVCLCVYVCACVVCVCVRVCVCCLCVSFVCDGIGH